MATIRTSSGEEQESYDYLIAASGLSRSASVVPQSLTRVTYLAEAKGQILAIEEAEEGIVVIGGGMSFPSLFYFLVRRFRVRDRERVMG